MSAKVHSVIDVLVIEFNKQVQFHTSTCKYTPAFPDQKPAEGISTTAERSNKSLVTEQRQ